MALPVSAGVYGPDAGVWAHGCCWGISRVVPRSSGKPPAAQPVSTQGPGGGPETHDDAHRGATGRTAGHTRGRRRARCRLVLAGVSLLHHQADGRERDGPAGLEQAAMPDFRKAIGQDRLEEPAEKRHDVELGGAEAGPAHLPGGEGNRAVLQAHETVVGDGNLEDRGGEGGAGRVAVVMGLRVDIPGDGPDLRGRAAPAGPPVASLLCRAHGRWGRAL